MAVILHIETATPVCSCTLARNGELLIVKENFEGQNHAHMLGVFVHEVVEYTRQNNLHIDAVAVSSGPGSYTGLRIGVSHAKGLSYGLDIPLIAIPTHAIMAFSQKDNVADDTLLCPMIDARRMEVYATVFDTNLNILQPTEAKIITETSFAELLDKQPVAFFGNGAAKCKDIITHPNARFIENVHPHAADMTMLAEKAFNEKDFVDVAYFEPFYLKDFVATKSRDMLKHVMR